MEIDKQKIGKTLDLLRLRLIQQQELNEQIKALYVQLNIDLGNIIEVPVDQKTKAKSGWGPDPDYQKPMTPEGQSVKAHQLSREF